MEKASVDAGCRDTPCRVCQTAQPAGCW